VKLVIVVVLDDGETCACGEVQEPKPAWTRERDRRGELMMRCHIHGTNRPARYLCRKRTDIETVFVHGHRQDLRAGEPERFPCRSVAWLLDGDRITRANQCARQEREGHLATPGDHDRLRTYDDPARRRQHDRELLAQARQTGGVVVRQERRPPYSERATVRAANQIGRDQAHIRTRTRHQKRPAFDIGRQLRLRRTPEIDRKSRRRTPSRATVAEATTSRHLRYTVSNEDPRSLSANQPPLGNQFVKGRCHRLTMDVQRAGERSRSGQAVARAQSPAMNVRRNGVSDLA
jgi:hypothetical protein